jgi:hypothetical protein
VCYLPHKKLNFSHENYPPHREREKVWRMCLLLTVDTCLASEHRLNKGEEWEERKLNWKLFYGFGGGVVVRGEVFGKFSLKHFAIYAIISICTMTVISHKFISISFSTDCFCYENLKLNCKGSLWMKYPLWHAKINIFTKDKKEIFLWKMDSRKELLLHFWQIYFIAKNIHLFVSWHSWQYFKKEIWFFCFNRRGEGEWRLLWRFPHFLSYLALSRVYCFCASLN